MARTSCKLLCILFGLPTVVFAASADDESAAAPVPKILTRFPDSITQMRLQMDGSAVCTAGATYLAIDDLRTWSAVPIQVEDSVRLGTLIPVGGQRNRLFFAATLEETGGWNLLRVEVGKKATILRKLPSQVASFASGNLGVAAVQFSVLLTNDGGTTWRHAARFGESEDVSALLWVSDSRVAVAGKMGSVQLLERRDDAKLHRLWAISLRQTGVYALTLDNDRLWVQGSFLHAIALADGGEVAKFKPGVFVEGIAACHHRLLLWHSLAGQTPDGHLRFQPTVSVWGLREHGKDFGRQADIRMPSRDGLSPVLVAAIFPEKDTKCLAFGKEGGAYLIDLNNKTVSRADLRVTPLPTQHAPGGLNEANMRLFQKMVALGKQVTPAEREAIVGEANSRTDLTPRQRMERAIDQLQRAIDSKKRAKPEK